jgi:carboxymethylenebutenolidase
VVLWPDAFGLRPSMREMGKRLAAEGYAVLVPNPFYRVAKAPVFETAANANFKDPALWEKLKPLMGSVQAAGAAERDATAFVAFLDAQPQVDKKKKIGTQGYCMGGALVLRTAAAVPGGSARASFHGGGLRPTSPSPHLLAPKIRPVCSSQSPATTTRNSRREGQAEGGLRRRQVAAQVECTRHCTAGACPTCRSRAARRSTSRPG